MKKKIVVLFLILALCINQLTFSVFAGSSSDFAYTESNGEITITKYLGWDKSEVAFPGTIDGKPVTKISSNVFSTTEPSDVPAAPGSIKNHTEITKVTFPENVQTIESNFSSCPNLTSVEIPGTVTNMDNVYYKFMGNEKLESIKVSDTNINFSSENGVLYNKDKSQLIFYPTGKKDPSFSVPSSVLSISYHAFGNDFLKSIDLNNVLEIMDFALAYSNSLDSIKVSDSNPNYTCQDGILYNKDKTKLIKYPDEKNISEFTIPSTITSIMDGAILYSHIKSIKISENVSYISKYNFSYGDLQAFIVDKNNKTFSSINGVLFNKSESELIKYPVKKPDQVYSVPLGIKKILSDSFSCNMYLTRLNIPASVTELENKPFFSCDKLNSIYFFGDAPIANNPFTTTDITNYSTFKFYYQKGAKGFTDIWNGFPTQSFEGVKYEIVAKPQWNAVGNFSEGLANVLADSKDPYIGKLWGYIDTKGNFVIPPKYYSADEFHEGVAAVQDTNSFKVKIIDKTGKVVLDSNNLLDESVSSSVYYSSASYCSEGLIGFNLNFDNSTDFYDIKGNFVVGNTKTTAMKLFPFSENLSCGRFFDFNDNSVKPGFIDKSGNITYTKDSSIIYMPGFDHGLSFAVSVESEQNYIIGIIDKTGSYVIQPNFDDALINTDGKSFYEGLAIVSKDSKWGVIDKTGKFISNILWDKMLFYSEGLAPVCKDEKWGAIDTKGNIVITPTYDSMTTFANGLAVVKKNDNFYFINSNGDYFGQLNEDINSFVSVNQNGSLFYEKNDLAGLLNITSTSQSLESIYPQVKPTTPVISPTPTTAIQQSANNLQPIISSTQASATPTATITSNASNTPTPTTSKDTSTNEKYNNDKKPSANILKDIENHWASEQIMELVNKNVISGYDNGTFKPDNNITRAELAVIIVKVLGLDNSTGNTKFKDDNDIPSWAKPYIKAAVESGIISGYNDNTFRANKPCTREEIVTLILKAFKLGTFDKALDFKDKKDIQSWSKGFISKAIELKIIKGYSDNTFKPSKNVTRAEAAVIVFNALKLGMLKK